MNDIKKIKLATIFGTRPEIIRLSRIFDAFDRYTNHIMIHTGQSFDYEMDKIFFEDLNIRKPDYFLEVKADTLGEQIANIIKGSEKVLGKERPDAIFVLGDTNSVLGALIGKRMKIPIFHMEAGNRSFDENVPEETNRKILDHISDINLAYSENVRQYLLKEGIHPGSIYVVGSPLPEVVEHNLQKIEKSNVLQELNLSPQKFFLVSLHREENIENEKAVAALFETLNSIAQKYDLPVIVSTHPRTAKKIQQLKLRADKRINFHKPFGYLDYMWLQKKSLCVISDSGTIQEESSILGFPAIQARLSSERPESFDAGVVVLAGLNKDSILGAIDLTLSEYKEGHKPEVPSAYASKSVSSKVVKLVTGLTNVIAQRRR